MTALPAGTEGTITATTAEGAAFQLFQWWQMKEADKNLNPNDSEYFTGTKNTDTSNQYFEGKWKLQISISNSGVISTIPLYQNLGFVVGTGGAITAATAEEYTLELILFIINKQKDTNQSNPEKTIYFTATANLNEGIIEGDFKIPYSTVLLPNGGTQDMAREYLL